MPPTSKIERRARKTGRDWNKIHETERKPNGILEVRSDPKPIFP